MLTVQKEAFTETLATLFVEPLKNADASVLMMIGVPVLTVMLVLAYVAVRQMRSGAVAAVDNTSRPESDSRLGPDGDAMPRHRALDVAERTGSSIW